MFELPPLVLGRRSLGGRSQPNLVFQFVSSALKIGAKCFVFSERFSTFVAPIFIALRVSQSDMTTQLTDLLKY